MKGIDAIKVMSAGGTCVYDSKWYRFNDDSLVESSPISGGLGSGTVWSPDIITRDMVVSTDWSIELNYNLGFMEAITFLESNAGNLPLFCIVSAVTHKTVYYDINTGLLATYISEDSSVDASFTAEEVAGEWSATLLNYFR